MNTMVDVLAAVIANAQLNGLHPRIFECFLLRRGAAIYTVSGVCAWGGVPWNTTRFCVLDACSTLKYIVKV
jgi:hypothetical protein